MYNNVLNHNHHSYYCVCSRYFCIFINSARIIVFYQLIIFTYAIIFKIRTMLVFIIILSVVLNSDNTSIVMCERCVGNEGSSIVYFLNLTIYPSFFSF